MTADKTTAMTKRLLTYALLTLAAIEVLLVLGSWIFTATNAAWPARTLLSGEGIRWVLGQSVQTLATPWLAWLLLLSMAVGSLSRCGILRHRRGDYRRRVALRIAIALAAVYVAVLLLLTVVPHAVLLSATGSLYPSPLSRAAVPLAALGVTLISAAYGWAAGRFATPHDFTEALTYGIQKAAPLFVLYAAIALVYSSLRFVVG